MAMDIISSIDAPVVQITNDQITTTSTDLAMHFGKRHADILRRVENLGCSAEFSERNFALAEYKDEQDKTRPMYRITRDGFVFLAMGFTGTKAAQFKEAYINAFNQMEKQQIEKQLNEQKHLPATSADTAVLETEKYKLINNIVTSMKLESNPVVVPASDLNDMVQAIRMYQQQIAQLRTPDWVNDNVDHIKKYANRTFLDDWPMPKHK